MRSKTTSRKSRTENVLYIQQLRRKKMTEEEKEED